MPSQRAATLAHAQRGLGVYPVFASIVLAVAALAVTASVQAAPVATRVDVSAAPIVDTAFTATAAGTQRVPPCSYRCF